MAQIVVDALLVAVGYLCGSLPMGVIIARLTGARDPRTVGSGRTGGTNALRAMGVRRAVLVAALDVLKGGLPVAAAILVGASSLGVALTAVAAVVGAWRSIFLGFHGGRGVATGIGATLVLQPLVIPLAAPFFFGTILLTRFVSLGSLIASAAGAAILGIFVWLGWNDWPNFLFGVVGASIVWIAHHDNIGRLARGEERKLDVFARGN